ncbi:MAG: putative toxin-antitoxin system toxin component, PIN family [Nevskia sp.]|nr:putative toxin-antitoxin system toxin component, PIN family [Nevskia sp.]
MTVLYVVDTNVVISALLTGKSDSPPALILNRMLAGELRYLLSVELLAEYRAVLLRPKIRAKHGLDESEVDVLLTEIAGNGAHREPASKPHSPDPKDAHLLALLDAEPRAVLVSGDELTLGAVTPLARAIRPRELVKRFGSPT